MTTAHVTEFLDTYGHRLIEDFGLHDARMVARSCHAALEQLASTVQALVVANKSTPPRRSVRGLQSNRVHQLLAALQRHAVLDLAPLDIYVNVVGGWQIAEPACDLPVALAVVSSFYNVPLGATAAWGEVGLGGEVRSVSFHARREEEARRIGVERVVASPPDRRFDLRSALLAVKLW